MTAIAEEIEDFLYHFTPSAEQRREFAAKGWALPDGSYYIRPLAEGGRDDLRRAILAIGRSTPAEGQSAEARRNEIRRHCIKRARTLGLTDMIPDTWNSDGSLKQSGLLLDDFLVHYGVLGMKWGVRREGSPSQALGTSRHPISSDAAKAISLQKQVKKQGVRSLSNDDLQTLINRMNLENQYGGLNQKQVNSGQKYVKDILKDSGKQIATQFIVKNAPKGVEHLIKKVSNKKEKPIQIG